MKRVLLIRNVAPECFGGGETYQLKLAEQLKKNGFEPYIVTASGKLLERGKELGVKVIRAPYNKRQNWSGVRNILLFRYIWWQKKLERWYLELLRDLSPAVVNVQSRDDFLAATLAARRCRVKVIWTDHMDFRSWVLQNVQVPFKNLIGKMILRLASDVNKIIMISDYEKKFLDGISRMENVVVIKNGTIDEHEKYKKIRFKKKSFVYVGRIVDYKGIKELIEAFFAVREKFPDAVLKIYGDGDIEKFRKMAGEGVEFCGETKEPLKVLAENEVFVLPSYREGLSLSLLDAAMMGKTIIASNVDGNPEVVEDGVSGLLVPAQNAKKLAEAMEKVLAEPKLAHKLAEGARKKYEREFNFEKIFAEKMLPLYNEKKGEK